MAKVKFERNHQGIGQLMKSKEMMAVLSGYADRIARPGQEKEVKVMETRAVAYVRSHKRDNSLLRQMKS